MNSVLNAVQHIMQAYSIKTMGQRLKRDCVLKIDRTAYGKRESCLSSNLTNNRKKKIKKILIIFIEK